MKRQTLAMAADRNSGFEGHHRPMGRRVLLAMMEQIAPHYSKPGKGRPPVGLERVPTRRRC